MTHNSSNHGSVHPVCTSFHRNKLTLHRWKRRLTMTTKEIVSFRYLISSNSLYFFNNQFQLDTQGPFSNLVDLKSRPAHLAVFINFLLANGSPNSLVCVWDEYYIWCRFLLFKLFYLIADCYQNASAALPKEQRKWAYEIFSTFLIPNSVRLSLSLSYLSFTWVSSR